MQNAAPLRTPVRSFGDDLCSSFPEKLGRPHSRKNGVSWGGLRRGAQSGFYRRLAIRKLGLRLLNPCWSGYSGASSLFPIFFSGMSSQLNIVLGIIGGRSIFQL